MALEYLNSPRVQGAILAAALAVPLALLAHDWWLNYWILKDGQTESALVTGAYWGGHGNVNYRYVVDRRQYTGHSVPDWRDSRYRSVGVGQHCPVYFSTSHPWLSLLYRPDGVLTALPVALVILLMESCAVTTIVKPGSRWALRLGPRAGGGWPRLG